MAHGHFVAELHRMRPQHAVNGCAVLDVRPPADPDPVHVAADDDAHPDAALLADLDLADDLRAVVDEGAGMNARQTAAVRADHAGELYEGRQAGQDGQSRQGTVHLPACPLPALCPPALVSRDRIPTAARELGPPLNVSRWFLIAWICASAVPPMPGYCDFG